MSHRLKRDGTQNRTTAPPFEIHNHLSTTQQGNWMAGQARPDLSCQISLAQQCVPSPTMGQIQKANAWVRRAHQFADLKLTFLSIPPEDFSIRDTYRLERPTRQWELDTKLSPQYWDTCSGSRANGEASSLNPSKTASPRKLGLVHQQHTKTCNDNQGGYAELLAHGDVATIKSFQPRHFNNVPL